MRAQIVVNCCVLGVVAASFRNRTAEMRARRSRARTMLPVTGRRRRRATRRTTATTRVWWTVMTMTEVCVGGGGGGGRGSALLCGIAGVSVARCS